MNCTTHHAACDCREFLFEEMAAENIRLKAENEKLRAAQKEPPCSHPQDYRSYASASSGWYCNKCNQWFDTPKEPQRDASDEGVITTRLLSKAPADMSLEEILALQLYCGHLVDALKSPPKLEVKDKAYPHPDPQQVELVTEDAGCLPWAHKWKHHFMGVYQCETCGEWSSLGD